MFKLPEQEYAAEFREPAVKRVRVLFKPSFSPDGTLFPRRVNRQARENSLYVTAPQWRFIGENFLKQKNVSDQLLTAGTVPAPSSPEQFAAYVKSEQLWLAGYGAIIIRTLRVD